MKYFSQTFLGDMFITTDDGEPVRRWSGLASSAELAGVPAPSAENGPSLATTGSGDISGFLYAFTRWLDSRGNPSNLSPISDVLNTGSSNGSVANATYTSPILIESTSHGLTTGDRIKITGVQGNYAANGTWDVTVLTANTFTLDGSVGNGLYQFGGTWRAGVEQIDYTDVEAPTDSRVVTRQVLRTLDGDASVAYVDLEETDLNATAFDSTKTDADLIALGTAFRVPLVSVAGDDLAISRYGQPPVAPFFAHNNGRMVAVGETFADAGQVSVTDESTTVNGVGTSWTSQMVGLSIIIDLGDASAGYLIEAVNVGAQQLTLANAFSGTSGTYTYSISGGGTSSEVKWSEALLPEAWSDTASLMLPVDSDTGDVTGIRAFNRLTYIFTENRIFSFYFRADPRHDGQPLLSARRGAVNQRCHLLVGEFMRVMDRQGIYGFDGQNVQQYSAAIQDLFQQNSDAPFKIQWNWRHYFHTVHDPEQQVVRFFVSFGGRYPKHAICHQYALDRWWIEEFTVGIASSCLGMLNGRQQVFLGTECKQIVALGHGHLDGPPHDAGTLRGTVTDAGMTWLEDDDATFPPSTDIVNAPLHIVSGTGKGQMRRIVSVSGTKLSVLEPWTTRPDATSVYQIGGIRWRFRTGWMRFVKDDTEVPRKIEAIFKPGTRDARLTMRQFSDFANSPRAAGRTLDSNGVATTQGSADVELNNSKASGFVSKAIHASGETESDSDRYLSLEFSGVTNAERQKLFQINLYGARQ